MRKEIMGSFTMLVMLCVFSFVGVGIVYAHCDTMNGPVIQDAKVALVKKDVTSVLKWVKKDKEAEIRAAFDTAIAEGAKGGEEKADMKFFETLVRVHRAGEGASFGGLKPAGAIEPIVAEADKALESGSSTELITKMTHHLTEEVTERFNHAVETRKHKDESVEAGREYVEAYVQYVHYVEGIHNTLAAKGGHHHEEAEGEEHEANDTK